MSVISPNLIGSYMAPLDAGGLHLGEAVAGRYATYEMLATAISAILSSLLVSRYRLSHLLIFSGSIVLAANLCSLLVSPPYLWALRIMTGGAAGVAVGIGNAIVARSIDPDRLYGLSTTFGTAGSALALVAAPMFVMQFGYTGIFGLLAILALILLPTILLLPAETNAPPIHVSHMRTHISPSLTLPLAASAILLNISDGGLYGFSQLIGIRSGLTSDAIGFVLAAGGLFGIAGSLLAAILGTRFGRIAPLAIAIGLKAVSSFVINLVAQPEIYVAMQWMLTLSFYVAITYMLGLSAAIDPSGVFPASIGGLILLGGSIGPLVGGVLVEHHGYVAFGIVSGGILAPALITFILAEKRLLILKESST